MKTVSNLRAFVALPLLLAGAAAAPAPLPLASTPIAAGMIQPHRAIYSIGLASSTHGSGVTSADGQMVFELTGSHCAGYTTRQRLIVDLGGEEGEGGVLDFRISTFETGSGDFFKFTSRTSVDEKVIEDLDGEARRTGSGVVVSLKEPTARTVELAPETLFPGQHLQAILGAARSDKRFVAAVIYEGAGSGAEADDAAAAIGAVGPAGKENPVPAGMRKWPISIGYFSDSRPAALPGLGEETPSHQMNFTLYENGVTDDLVMDYGQYALSGTLDKLEPLSPGSCD